MGGNFQLSKVQKQNMSSHSGSYCHVVEPVTLHKYSMCNTKPKATTIHQEKIYIKYPSYNHNTPGWRIMEVALTYSQKTVIKKEKNIALPDDRLPHVTSPS